MYLFSTIIVLEPQIVSAVSKLVDDISRILLMFESNLNLANIKNFDDWQEIAKKTIKTFGNDIKIKVKTVIFGSFCCLYW